ncbi:MAG: PGPGW domain-containing protein [Lentisphaeria bacterium]
MLKKLFSEVAVKTYRAARRLVVGVVGVTVVLFGLTLLFLPGPAVVVIPLGLAILGLEFAWARRLLLKMRNTAGNTWERVAEGTFKDRKKDEKKEQNHNVSSPD